MSNDTGNPRPPRRRVISSAAPTARPRRIAGSREEEAPRSSGTAPDPAPPADDQESLGPRPSAGFAGTRTTLALVVALVLLVLTLAGEAWYVWGREEPATSSSRPVVAGTISHRAGVEAASRAAEQILSRSFEEYDAQVEDATELMTDAFAAEYRQTVADIRADFVKARTELVMDVVAAGVVRASSEQVQALLFLNQYVTKKGQETSVTPYRALVTVVRADGGWLVQDIETR
ncbi:hypothetical protein [Nocardioides sp.]|uniref:hypothetical protein n=1 Tax=Nocardioides sp. TaxID=35761 RepID=UPI00356645B3